VSRRSRRMLARVPPAAAAGGGSIGTALLGLVVRALLAPSPAPVPRPEAEPAAAAGAARGWDGDLDDLLASAEFRIGLAVGLFAGTLLDSLQAARRWIRDVVAALTRPGRAPERRPALPLDYLGPPRGPVGP